MPHLILEISDNIQTALSTAQILEPLQEILVRDGKFDLIKIKSRIYRIKEYLVASGLPENAFVHLTVKILDMHPEEIQQNTGRKLLNQLERTFALPGSKLNISITVEFVEMNHNTYFKLNSGTIR